MSETHFAQMRADLLFEFLRVRFSRDTQQIAQIVNHKVEHFDEVERVPCFVHLPVLQALQA
jgi:hypothetical protein